MEFDHETGLWHEPTRKNLFQKALSAIAVNKQNSFFDIGCGKGFVLMMASKYPFAEIAGVELSPKMYQICLQNLQKNNLTRIKVIFKNAINLTNEYDSYDVFFMYNPFKENVVRQVVTNLIASAVRNPRKMRLIYHNPKHGEILSNQGFKIIKKINENHLDQTRRIYIYQLEKIFQRDS